MKNVLQNLGKVSELWRDPKHPLREETIQALQVSTGFSRRRIELALASCFEELSLPKMTAYVRDSVQDPISNVDVFHVLAANVFTAWVHGAVITLLCGGRCLLKPSVREPVFARAWKNSLDVVDPNLSKKVEIVSWDKKRIQDCQAVVAYGSDEALQKIQSLIPATIPFVGYGHKLSVGIIFKEAINEDLLDLVQQDVEPFGLQGCLSPQILYMEDPQFKRWPALEAVVNVPPKILPFESWGELMAHLETFYPYLSCVGYSGSVDKKDFLTQALRHHKGLRICPLGEMQRPPLSWRNGGIDLADLLHSIPQNV